MDLKEWLGKDNTIGMDIWKKKYQYQDESFDEWLDRVSGGNAEIRQLIAEKKFLYGGRILANRGIEGNKTYSNCYVLAPPEDNLESIYETASKLARTFSYGGGVGIDLGKLRPKGAKVNNAAKTTSGAVSFMELFNTTTGLIGQNGRRGALMLSMPISHPDIEEFITAKEDVTKLTNCNISVRVDDEFMEAVRDDAEYQLGFIVKETGEVIVRRVYAKKLFHKICELNHKGAEPGVLFWDNICKGNLMEKHPEFQYAGVNPCAEEPLPAGGSCLLGAINLSEFVKNPFSKTAYFDSNEFSRAVDIAIEGLNEVLDEGLPLHPLKEQRDSVEQWKQIGLGIMGLADCLIKLGCKYGSERANGVCSLIGYTMLSTATASSEMLAHEKGGFPKFDFIKVNESRLLTETLEFINDDLRNSQLLTIAPTGTISTMLGVSGGIEPIFANSYNRRTESLHGETVNYKVFTPIVKEYMELHHITDEKDLPDYFVTAKDIDYIDRIECQSVWQKYIDAAISSTINLPNSATVEDIEDIYMLAWEKGLKGVTIYREGCERSGVLTTDTTTKTADTTTKNIGLERHLVTGCGSLHVCAYFDEHGNLRNTYLSKGSTGGCNNYMIGLSRMISLAARNNVGIDDIVDQLNSCGVCPSYAVRKATKGDVSPGACCPVAIGRALKEMYAEINKTEVKKTDTKSTNLCPKCKETVVQEGGCVICKNCGWSKCD